MEDQFIEIDVLILLEVVIDLGGVHLVLVLVVLVRVPGSKRQVEDDLHAVPTGNEQERQGPRHDKLWENEWVDTSYKLYRAEVNIQITK